MRKAPKSVSLQPINEDINRIIAVVRARVEHLFPVLKRQFGYLKTRYRGLVKTGRYRCLGPVRPLLAENQQSQSDKSDVP